MSTWRRTYNPSWGSGWTDGVYYMRDEFVVNADRDMVQELAVQHAGAELPDEAFPPPQDESMPRTVAEMEALILDLLSKPRRDLE
jgi:hypothetical protein